MCRTSSRFEKLSLVIFLKKLFLKTSQALKKYSYLKKKLFQKITGLNFSSLDDVLHILAHVIIIAKVPYRFGTFSAKSASKRKNV